MDGLLGKVSLQATRKQSCGEFGLTGWNISQSYLSGGTHELRSFSFIPVSHWLRAAPGEDVNSWACSGCPACGQSRYWKSERALGQSYRCFLLEVGQVCLEMNIAQGISVRHQHFLL